MLNYAFDVLKQKNETALTLQHFRKHVLCISMSHSCLPAAGLRPPPYKALASKAPVLPVAHIPSAEPRPTDIDVSDLGSRNYGARSDFYCLVTEDDI